MPEVWQKTTFGKGKPCYLHPEIDVKKNTKTNLVIATAIMFAGTTIGFSKDQIRTYSVPKGHPTVKAAAPMADNSGVDVNSSPVQWTTPKEWQELAPTVVRIGNFVIPGEGGKKAEITVTSFPGDVGGELGNVTRWRGELGLQPVSAEQITSEPVKIAGRDAKLYDFSSADARTIVASLPKDGSTWFFKIRGDKKIVTDSLNTFHEFLKSIRFEGGKAHGNPAATGAADTTVANDAADPHAGLGIASDDPHAGIAGAPPIKGGNDEASDQPKWQVPPHWNEKKAGMMVMKSFSVSHEGKEATVAISVLNGDGGGTFGNVNRWRGQVGLPPIAKEDLDKQVSSLDVENGGKGTVVDLKGVDGKHMIAVAVPHAGATYFYKLLGDETVVAHEKDTFLKFVQNVRYP